ncbi:unnamed protein product [Gadus morhua 'NCC']
MTASRLRLASYSQNAPGTAGTDCHTAERMTVDCAARYKRNGFPRQGGSLEWGLIVRSSHHVGLKTMWWSALTGPLCASLLVTLVALACGGPEPRRPSDGPQGAAAAAAGAATPGDGGGGSYGNRQYHKIQHGQCSYTFILPEETGGGAAAAAGGAPCREGKGGGGGGGGGGARTGVGTATGAGVRYNTNALQRDAPPPPGEPDYPSQKIQHLEHIMDNYTQWLHKFLCVTLSGFGSRREAGGDDFCRDGELEPPIKRGQGARGSVAGVALPAVELDRPKRDGQDSVYGVPFCRAVPNSTKKAEEDKKHRDCADVYQAGFHKNGVYTIYITPQETKKVYCNMESAGGGWTVVQRREDGSVDFQRTWKEYKMGFGNPAGEHWLGNEFMYLLSSQRPNVLRVELTDWNGHQAFSLYDRFLVGSEKQNYRLSLKSHSGTAGRQSSLVIHGADFSTTDMDNDSCLCKCALMLTGGWWFDACGPSNLNGMYFAEGQHIGKLNGIKWHYFKGPSYSLRATTMMIRPLDFT